jgi:Fe-S-cluster-containing dehydrogenase component
MTQLPTQTDKKLGLVIDLDICVGCHACVVNCKEWNTSGYGAPLGDTNAYDADPLGSWLNRIHTYEVTPQETPAYDNPSSTGASPSHQCGSGDSLAQLVHFPKSCLHCEDAPCVTVCPTGASMKRSEDGIVLVEEDKCIGCGLCAWSCPYGAREMDPMENVMKKCTLCVDRIYNDNLPEIDRTPACVRTCPANARHFGDFADPNSDVSIMVKERGGMDLMPEMDTKPVNKYLPPRAKVKTSDGLEIAAEQSKSEMKADGFLGWLDKALEKMG